MTDIGHEWDFELTKDTPIAHPYGQAMGALYCEDLRETWQWEQHLTVWLKSAYKSIMG